MNGALLLSLALAACTGTAAPTSPSTTPEPVTAASGFVCPQPQPQIDVSSSEINLFLWTEYIPGDILECFGLVYGIDVNVEEYSSNEELFAKLAAGATGYDIVHPSDYIINVMVRRDMLKTLDPAQIPNSGNINPEYLPVYGDLTRYISPFQFGTQAIVYNAATVPNPPTSWADLWKPEYADQIVAVDDTRVIIGMTLLSLGYSVNATDPAQLAEAEAKLRDFAQTQVRLWDSDSPKSALIAGDAQIGIVWNGEAFLAQQEVETMTYVFPAEGSILFEDGFAIPSDAPHEDAAYAWINYLLQGDVAWLPMQDYPYTVANAAALEYARLNQPAVYEAYMGSIITNAPPEALAASHRVEDIGDVLTEYDRIWTEIKGD
jgi:spermidine/putrescine-binding protein